MSHHEKVLILIVVDDGLVLSFNSCNTCGISGVLILVVVEDGLARGIAEEDIIMVRKS